MKCLIKILLILFFISGGILPFKSVKAKQVYKKVIVKQKRYEKYPAKGSHTLYVNAAKRIKHSKGVFYHANGIYYRKSTRGYKIVAAPLGYRVKVLPTNYIQIVLNDLNYFYHYGTYYVAVGKKFEVVKPPLGLQVDELPNGYKLVSNNGRTYYVVDGVTYKRIVLESGIRVFQVIEIS